MSTPKSFKPESFLKTLQTVSKTAAAHSSDPVKDLKSPDDKGYKEIPEQADGNATTYNQPSNSQNPNKTSDGGPSNPGNNDPAPSNESPDQVRSGDEEDKSYTSHDKKLASAKKRGSELLASLRTAGKKTAGASESGNDTPERKDDDQLSPAFHFKIASYVLQNEDLAQKVHDLMEEDVGAEQAKLAMANALAMEEGYASYHHKVASLQQQESQMTEEELRDSQFLQAVHGKKLSSDYSDKDALVKLAYQNGAMEAEGLMGAGLAAPDASVEDYPLAGAGEEASIEEIIATLDMMLQAGEITEEEYQMVLAELEQGMAMEGQDEMAKVANYIYEKSKVK